MRFNALAIGLAVLALSSTTSFAATDPADKCVDSKAKTAGKKAADVMKAVGKNISKNPDTKLGANLSKAQSKFTKGFTKAESKGSCLTNGDAAAIEAKIDAFVNDVALSFECECCNVGDLVRYETLVGVGTAGELSRFVCSNSDSACVDDSDCDFGTCVTVISGCLGNPSATCSIDSDCVGTCGEDTGGSLPIDLVVGGLYTGGGLNSVPLPLPVPDQEVFITKMDGCGGPFGPITMGPATAADTAASRNCTEGRKCSGSAALCVLDSDCAASQTCDTNCIFGTQLPIPNPSTPATSVCVINHVAEDASGTFDCASGDTDLSLPLRSVVHLNGDLLSGSVGPVDVPGVQPCPLCVRQCSGGTNDRAPCADATDCQSGSCGGSTECLGGPGDGDPCTAETSGSDVLGVAFPTSLDCPLDSNNDVTKNIGGLPIAFALTSGSVTEDAVDQPESPRAFAGFCRDVSGAGSLCFEGDTGSCPAAIPPADGTAVACNDDSDCQSDTDEYESCAQRSPGAFSFAGATRIELQGSPAPACIAGGAQLTTLVSAFDIPPTFDSTVDAAGDLPGPGVAIVGSTVEVAP